MTARHRVLYSKDVAELITAMDPSDPWDEQRARRWMKRPGEAGVTPGFKLSGVWVTTVDRLRQAYPLMADEFAEQAADALLEAEAAAPECDECERLRARLLDLERALACVRR